MRQFFKFTFASCLGVFLALILIGGISLLVFSTALSNMGNKAISLKPNTVLYLDFKSPIPEKTNNLEQARFSLNDQAVTGLHDMIGYIAKAKEDPNIKGIVLESDNIMANKATLRSIRNALLDFKKGGKWIYAYNRNYSQSDYYLSSVADKVYLHPMGSVDFKGYGTMIMFFKDLLDKIGVSPQVYYAGQFKSATEPFRYNKMSEQNRLQLHEYLDNLYGTLLADVSASRKISSDSLKSIANRYEGQTAEGSKRSGLIDDILYPDEFSALIKKKIGLKEKDDIESISMQDLSKALPLVKDFSAKDKIGVVYAEGSIVDGKGSNGSIGGDKYAEIIRKMRKDENIKAIVLRVNSPGGSALASDLIWREIEMAKKAKIPVIVSMGDYAASGGYYIACNADSILAEPNTLTGSIGVFAMIPNARKLMNDKLGITFDTVATGPFAIGITPFTESNPDQDRMIQSWIEATYGRFVGHVAKGRNMAMERVEEIAQGRIWTGQKAVELGLVDRIGTLDDAIRSAASMAKLDKYRTQEYPKPKDQLTQLIEELSGRSDDEDDNIKSRLIQSGFKEYAPMYRFIKEVQEMKTPQARLPFYLEIR